ncbi:MAG: replication initiator [Pseudonocardia sp.]
MKDVDAQITGRLRAAGFAEWRAQVDATRGCSAPIHLRGSSRVLDADGAVLIQRDGTVLAPCGNRRESGPRRRTRTRRTGARHRQHRRQWELNG